MTAFYNEIDPSAAAWLRNLIAAGHIAPGVVDERSIEDITPNELAQYTQCHFFAGIGGWSHALRLAGWPDDEPVWTGSCPCQPFSAAGKGAGFADERHLWPAFHHLIEQCRPAVVFGEQVASKDGLGWLDLVRADLEGTGYAVGAADLCAAGVGAPHIRQRLYWVAEPKSAGSRGQLGKLPGSAAPNERALAGQGDGDAAWPDGAVMRLADSHGRDASAEREQRSGQQRQQPQDGCTEWLANANGRQRDGISVLRGNERNGQDAGRAQGGRGVAACGGDERMADTYGRHASAEREQRGGQQRQQPQDGDAVWMAHAESRRTAAGEQPGQICIPECRSAALFDGLADAPHSGRREECEDAGRRPVGDSPQGLPSGLGAGSGDQRPGPAHGYWSDADWLRCRDDKWRPVEPGTQPLAHGLPGRVVRLRGYGNAIAPQVAAVFIDACRQPRLA